MAIVTSRTDSAAVPSVDPSTCTACGICCEICPTATLQLRDGAVRIDKATPFGCIGCGQCMAVCPTGAILVLGRCLSPADRSPLPPPAQRATAGQLAALLNARRSIRHFAEPAVPPEVVERILALAASAPMGIPPSEVGVVVFHGRDKVQAFAKDMVGLMNGGLRFFRTPVFKLLKLFMGKTSGTIMTGFVVPLFETITADWERGQDHLLYDAPLALLFHYSPYGDPADADIAATYAMLAAEALGLGTCLIGSVAPVLVRDKSAMARFGLPAGNKPALVLIAGYPRYDYQRTLRRSFADVVFH